MKGVMILVLFHCVGGYCDPPCVHGECTAGDVCRCNPGYKGEACDESGMLISSLLYYMSTYLTNLCQVKFLSLLIELICFISWEEEMQLYERGHKIHYVQPLNQTLTKEVYVGAWRGDGWEGRRVGY